MPAYYIGLMSGTSVDGIDAVLVDLSDSRPVLLAAGTGNWDPALRESILTTLDQPSRVSLESLGQLDAALGDAFAEAALDIIREAGLQPEQIVAIGSHGQTLLHPRPPARHLHCRQGTPAASRRKQASPRWPTSAGAT
jgi:anhydro-N-acetylmuramic acid kinase